MARTLDVLAKSKVKLIYLALDGPKTPEQSLSQSRIIHLAQEICTANGIVLQYDSTLDVTEEPIDGRHN